MSAAFSSGYFLLRGASAELRFDLMIDGEPKEADEMPRVTVVRDDGQAVITEQSVTGTKGEYAIVLTPEQTAALDILTATWSAKVEGSTQTFVTRHEIVGGYLAGVSEIRASLPKGTTATDDGIVVARTLAEGWLEDECHVAFRPRYARDTLDGSGEQKQLLDRPRVIVLREVSVAGEVLDLDGLKMYPSGAIWASTPWPEGAQNISVAYEHGFLSPPSRVSRAAVRLARHFIVENPSDYDERASSMSTDEAHYTFITPGMRGAVTSIPEVNVVIEAFEYREGIA